MAHVLEINKQELKIKDEVDSSQFPVFTDEYFRPQHLVKARKVDGVAVRSYVSFLCKNIQ